MLARQPIFSTTMGVVGYELLHRPAPSPGRPSDSETATSSVILGALADIGLDELVGGHRAFVNFTREFLLAVRPLPLPAERVVLEVIEDQIVDASLLDVLAELRAGGFPIALDDFVYAPELEPLLALADIVKLDVRALSPLQLAEHTARLAGRGLTLVAEKVETREEYDLCRTLGFDAFQGYFFTRPALMRAQPIATWRLGALRLAAAPESSVSFEDIEQLLRHDAGLAHKLLRYANSAALFTGTRVSSIREAMLRLGSRTILRWATMLALSGGADRSDQLLVTGLIRARLCELLAGDDPAADPDRAYTAGLLSVVDGLLDTSMPEVLEQLPLDDLLVDALLRQEGPEGRLLRAATAFEAGDFAAVATLHPDPAALAAHYRAAVNWAERAAGALNDG
jgi:EAL and modified HD-GYP domain-containing signal transduction protein